jgi:PAS domain S-box-containing protein
MNSGTTQPPPHILILEDDATHRDLIFRAFREDPGHFRISVAGTLREARVSIERDPPDLIVADWVLPDGKGIEILPRNDGVVTIPLIIMTSHGDEQLAVEIMKSGAIDYVVKSATVFKELPHIVRRGLRDWENIRQRELAETEKRDTEKRLADIIGVLPDAVLAVDNEGRVIAWNRAMEAMTGIPAASMLGKGDYEYGLSLYGKRRPILVDLVLHADAHIEKEYLSVQHQGEKLISESFIPAVYGGRGAYVWATASPLYDTAGNRAGAIETIRDITDRKQNEKLLEEREATLETLLNAPGDTIALLDRQGTLLGINEEGAKRLGGTVESLTGRIVHDLLPREVAASRKAYLDGVFETGKPARFDDTRSGMYLHNEIFPIFNAEHTAVERIAVFARDVTDQKIAEQALLESEERFRQALDNLPDVVVIYDTDMKIRFINTASLRITGRPRSDFIGKREEEVWPPEVNSIYLPALRATFETGTIHSLDTDLVLPGTGVRNLSITCVPLLDENGRVREVLGITHDFTDRKSVENDLRESEAKFRDIFNSVNDAVQIHEVDESGLPGRFVEVNDVACRMLQYTREELLTKSPLELTTDYHSRPLEKLGEELKTIGHATFETGHRRKDGTIIAVEINAHVSTLLGKKVVVSVVRDITERNLAEEALRRSETRFRALIQNSSDIIRILDQEGRIIYESPSTDRILGYPVGYLIGRDPMEYIHPDDLATVRKERKEVFDRVNTGIPTEFRIRKADGEYIWVDSIGVNLLDVPGVNGIVITTRPIQQRKHVEQALRESEERLRLALEGADAGFWDWDLPSGRATFSDRYYTMLGYAPGEFPATYDAWVSLMHPDDRENVLPELLQQIREKRPQCEIEHRLLSKDGNWIWILGRGKIVGTDDQGNPVRLTGVNIDITNRRLMESEIRSLNTVLEQRVKDRTDALSKANEALEAENAQRVQAEGRLKAAYDEKVMLVKEIHHRVKNNLQIIISLLNLQSRYITDESTLAAIRESQNRVRAMSLVHEKLYQAENVSKIKIMDYIRFLGNGLIQFYGAKSQGVLLTLDIGDVDATINMAIPFGLIINELISNSLKYAFPEGRPGEITIAVTREDKALHIQYRDNGVGIPETLDWKNTKSLGLRLVNSLVDQLNGTVELDRHEGTLFTMVLHEKE